MKCETLGIYKASEQPLYIILSRYCVYPLFWYCTNAVMDACKSSCDDACCVCIVSEIHRFKDSLCKCV